MFGLFFCLVKFEYRCSKFRSTVCTKKVFNLTNFWSVEHWKGFTSPYPEYTSTERPRDAPKSPGEIMHKASTTARYMQPHVPSVGSWARAGAMFWPSSSTFAMISSDLGRSCLVEVSSSSVIVCESSIPPVSTFIIPFI